MNSRERAVFVTGASGFLAGELVPKLVKSYPGSKIYLLLRAKDERSLQQKRANIVAGLSKESASEVLAVAGNVELSDLGLGTDYDFIAREVGHIYHSAASTRFDQPLEQARQINFKGTENIVNFARHVRKLGYAVRLHHISTAYVAGDRVGLIKEDQLDCGQKFFNTYEQSKFESELLLQQIIGEIATTIYRPSIIVGDSKTGRTQHFHVIYDAMRWVYSGQLSFIPCRPELKLDIVPVDYVCSAIVEIGQKESSISNTYHLTSGLDRSINLREMVDECMKEMNLYNRKNGKEIVAVPEVVTPDMVEKFEGDARRRYGIFFERAWQQMKRHMPYAVSEKVFDDSNTRAILDKTPITCPHFRDYLTVIVRYGLEREFRS